MVAFHVHYISAKDGARLGGPGLDLLVVLNLGGKESGCTTACIFYPFLSWMSGQYSYKLFEVVAESAKYERVNWVSRKHKKLYMRRRNPVGNLLIPARPACIGNIVRGRQLACSEIGKSAYQPDH